MNYYQLLSAVQDYSENNFPVTYLANGQTVSPTQQINRFIEQAELRIYNTVQIPALRKNVTGTATTNTPYLACPDDYLSSFSLAAVDPVTGEYEYLLNKDITRSWICNCAQRADLTLDNGYWVVVIVQFHLIVQIRGWPKDKT